MALPDATALKLDGDLNDAAWANASVVTDFKQRDPKENAPPTFRTEARIAYDSTALYVAVQAFDSNPEKIVGLLTRRDDSSPSDWIRVIIDSYHDRRTAYEFAVNPAGVKEDSYWYDDGNQDYGWDAVWDVAVSKNDKGWRAEFRIPFSQLRFTNSDSPVFGLGLVRQIGRLNESDSWPLIAKSHNGYVSQFGQLTGLKMSKPPKRLELVPYTVAQLDTTPAPTDGNPLVNTSDAGVALGMDMKYAVTPGLTLTATVNPDFGQVEADPAVVNLTAFETFFAERRPFFIEGSSSFNFDLDCNDGQCSGLFYSRRIGRQPHLTPDIGDDQFTSQPAQTTIIGAAKVTGRIGGFRVGALNAITGEENAIIASGPARTGQVVEPLTSYTVMRARKEFADQSSLGFMLTSTNRALGPGGTPVHDSLAKAAYTGGVDLDWRLGKKYSITSYWAGSSLHGDEAAIASIQEDNVHSFQRPDSNYLTYDPTRTSLNGNAGFAAFNKISGERTRFNFNVGYKSPGFDVNDVGFLRRADQISQSSWLQWRNDRPGNHVRSFRFNLNQWSTHNFDGDRLDLGGNINAHWVLRNNWDFGVGHTRIARTFDDRLTRGGPGGYLDHGWSLWSYVDSDKRKRVGVGWFFGGGRFENGQTFLDFTPTVQVRPTTALTVIAGISIDPHSDHAQWVEQDAAGNYVFGRLDQRTVSFTARVNYTITPTLTVQLYAQPFVSAGHYDQFKRLVDGRAASFANRYEPYAYDGNPDFNYRSFRSTNVLRWEYKPGSALFIVWQQGRENTADYGQFNFSRDFGQVFSTPASNVFLVKMSYWLNF